MFVRFLSCIDLPVEHVCLSVCLSFHLSVLMIMRFFVFCNFIFVIFVLVWATCLDERICFF